MTPGQRKQAGAYYTPPKVAETLLRWVLRHEDDRLLDPSCGDGQFIAGHKNSVGIEQDQLAASRAMERAPWALVHEGDFFTWAQSTPERFTCTAGNPPFIRYQTFKGEVRERALALCSRLGAKFSGLTSSWAPFLVAAASLVSEGGRLAFVVPAEIGHAPYAAPLIEYLTSHFGVVHVIAVKSKLFPYLSEDCWLLFADGCGAQCSEIRFTTWDALRRSDAPPRQFQRISVIEWRRWGSRLRPFLLPQSVRDHYLDCLAETSTIRLGDIANVGIGYVTGANEFFHLRPSQARAMRIPRNLLHPTVRNGRSLPRSRLGNSTIAQWEQADDPFYLLKIGKNDKVPKSVTKYLDSEDGRVARAAYKCRTRDPWFSVPDVQVPDFFLSYMSGREPNLVANDAGCTATNSLHIVRLKPGILAGDLLERWTSNFARLSCELEGHPLGGGMLKLEPREASRVALPSVKFLAKFTEIDVNEALETMHEWRHYDTSR